MSGTTTRFDLFGADLLRTQVIEASAGTGKTWTITGLYVRLLLETELAAPEILVVTYTKAATAELKARIRDRLVDTVAVLLGKREPDEFGTGLLERFSEEEIRTIARRRCQRALYQLDEASVFTIHGFCQRVLEDAAFESGAPFEAELVPDESEALLACTEDFWRRFVQDRSAEFLQYLVVDRKYTPEKLLAEVRDWTGRPYFKRLLPEDGEAGSDTSPQDECPSELARLRVELLDWLDREMPRRKRERRELGYDDLLLNLREALRSEERGQRLAARIRSRFGAALIDEFQDTDPIQYEIFDRIWGGREEPVFLVGDPKQAIYGFRGADIFAYLGARDRSASQSSLEQNWRTDPPLIAGVNALFESVPEPFVFDRIGFQSAEPARMPRPEVRLDGWEDGPLRIWFCGRDEGDTDLRKRDAVQEEICRAVAGRIATLLDAGARGDARIGEEALGGRNIAVLVQNHLQGDAIRRALARVGVASARQGTGNVFASREAEELERVLLAIAEPGRERRIRAALATSFHGFDAEALYRIAQTDRDWDAMQTHFRELREKFLGQGVAVMLAHWMSQADVFARLLATNDGERSLTNLLHLLELLRSEALRKRQGIERLVGWFAEHRSRAREAGGGATSGEELMLRLESDENVVQIVTVHGSKGLEYDVVFCPFTALARRPASPKTNRDPVLDFHDPNDDWIATLDLGSRERERNLEHRAREDLGNDLRLLYVALTRARHACVFTWGPVENIATSALGWLLLPRESEVDGLPDDAFRQCLAGPIERSGGAICVEEVGTLIDAAAARTPTRHGSSVGLEARKLSRSIRTTRWTTSFSALTAGRGAERRDYDGLGSQALYENVPDGHDIFSFPRGAGPGVCLHKIFELIDFAEGDSVARRKVVVDVLGRWGFQESWTDVVADMVEEVLHTPVDDDDEVRLIDLPRSRRLDELEFHYPAARITREELNELFERHGLPGLSRSARDGELPTPLTQGYLKGYIDLVFESGGQFFLADYKSNWLGARIENYAAQLLPEVMHENLYTIQYLTYSIALHRMLERRVPAYDYDRHFGGVRYLFLRGMKPELGAGSGVFAHRPPRLLVEEFDERLRG